MVGNRIVYRWNIKAKEGQLLTALPAVLPVYQHDGRCSHYSEKMDTGTPQDDILIFEWLRSSKIIQTLELFLARNSLRHVQRLPQRWHGLRPLRYRLIVLRGCRPLELFLQRQN